MLKKKTELAGQIEYFECTQKELAAATLAQRPKK